MTILITYFTCFLVGGIVAAIIVRGYMKQLLKLLVLIIVGFSIGVVLVSIIRLLGS